MPFNTSFNPLAKPAKPAFKVGDIVSFNEPGRSGRYGVICELDPSLQSGGRTGPYYWVKYIEPRTGKVPACPDSRCKTHCAICSSGDWEAGIKPFPLLDILYYMTEKPPMIDESLRVFDVGDLFWLKTATRKRADAPPPIETTNRNKTLTGHKVSGFVHVTYWDEYPGGRKLTGFYARPEMGLADLAAIRMLASGGSIFWNLDRNAKHAILSAKYDQILGSERVCLVSNESIDALKLA